MFKFCPVDAAEPPTASPSLDSAGWSLNVSPVTSWDWSATASVSSRSSTRRRPAPASPPSRHRTADVSNLPGMKILIKDGRDVTNSASRGSKTKEQRDHAHLMRIIKACDSCRRKKIRCDPSHKKRGTQPQQPSAAKKPRVSPRERPPPPPADELASVDLDPLFSFSGLEASDPWDEFIQFPPADCDFFLDPDNYLFPQSSASSASKVLTPQSQAEAGAPPGPDGLQASPQYPFMDLGSAGDYTDFNLYLPELTFSEDDRMLSVASSCSLGANQPLLSECPPAGPGAGWDDATAMQLNASGDNVGGAGYFDLGRLAGGFGSVNPSPSSFPARSLGPVVIYFPEPDGRARGSVSKSPSAPGPDATGVASRGPSAARVSRDGTSTASIWHRSESPSAVGQDYVAATSTQGHAQHGPYLSVLQEGALGLRPVSTETVATGLRLARPEVHDEAGLPIEVRDSPTGNVPASVSVGVDNRSTAVVPSAAESPDAVSPRGVASWLAPGVERPWGDCRVGLARVSAGQQPAADSPARSRNHDSVDLAPSSLGRAAGPPGRLDASVGQAAVSTLKLTQMAFVVAAVAAVWVLALCVCGWSVRSTAHVLGAVLVLAAKATATVSMLAAAASGPHSQGITRGSTLWAVSRTALAGVGAGCRGRE